MSHVAMQETKPGEPMFVDLACLQQAAEMLGMEVVQTPHYTWYNQSVGDYPLPSGMKASDLGHNALFILRIKEPKRSQLRQQNGQDPYDIGIVADPNNPGCYVPLYDYFLGGYGLTEHVGEPLHDPGDYRKVTQLVPRLKQYYDMCCDVAAAKEAGDHIELLTLKEASIKYPQYIKPSSDVDTWVSVSKTAARLGVE